ncbi:MAG: alkaline phosphatase family protein [Clostridia bacterium]|nr:alkaline phosphatase family protein [Clostridia bacterium]
MDELYNQFCITGVTATVLNLMGLPVPAEIESPLVPIVQKWKNKTADRALLYNPDAVALWLYQKYTNLFTPVIANTQTALPLLSVMPSVTPVCFASMYTGLLPVQHGIRKYEKPVLQVKTLFDYLIENGKKPAIVSTSNDSISRIFLEREMDYYIYDTVAEVNEKAMQLIQEDKYDVIVIYNGNYDSRMHKTGPESQEALQELADNAATFANFVQAIQKYWFRHNTFYGFMPDHGCHAIDGDCGSHGLDMAEDMNVIHFYGFNEKQ